MSPSVTCSQCMQVLEMACFVSQCCKDGGEERVEVVPVPVLHLPAACDATLVFNVFLLDPYSADVDEGSRR